MLKNIVHILRPKKAHGVIFIAGELSMYFPKHGRMIAEKKTDIIIILK